MDKGWILMYRVLKPFFFLGIYTPGQIFNDLDEHVLAEVLKQNIVESAFNDEPKSYDYNSKMIDMCKWFIANPIITENA